MAAKASWHCGIKITSLSPYVLYLMDDEYKITKHLGWMDWRKVVVLTVRKEYALYPGLMIQFISDYCLYPSVVDGLQRHCTQRSIAEASAIVRAVLATVTRPLGLQWISTLACRRERTWTSYGRYAHSSAHSSDSSITREQWARQAGTCRQSWMTGSRSSPGENTHFVESSYVRTWSPQVRASARPLHDQRSRSGVDRKIDLDQ